MSYQQIHGVHTGMKHAVVNTCLQVTLALLPGSMFVQLFNPFPAIALVFSIVAAANSRKPERLAMAQRFAKRARTMNLISWILLAISVLLLFFVIISVYCGRW